MIVSNRVLNTILDHMLELLPDEPADSKRLDDIVDADARAPGTPSRQAASPGSGIRPKAIQSKLRVASRGA